MNLEKIDRLARVPRTVTPELEQIRAKPFFLLRDALQRWEQGMTHGMLVYCVVIQANACLYDPGQATWAPAVLAYALDSERARDEQWLNRLAERLRRLKTEPVGDPLVDFVGSLLQKEDGDYNRSVPQTLTGGVPAKFFVTVIDPETLPGKRIPENHMLPALIVDDEPAILPPHLYL